MRIQTSLNSDISAFDSHMLAMGRQGLDWIVKSKVINANTIKGARDLLWSSFKFKPWGAIKLANGLNGALAVAGIAFEAWDSWKEAERIKEFEKGKQSLIKNLEEQRRELLEKVNGADFPLNSSRVLRSCSSRSQNFPKSWIKQKSSAKFSLSGATMQRLSTLNSRC